MKLLWVAGLNVVLASIVAAQDESPTKFDSYAVEIRCGVSLPTGAPIEKLEIEDLRIEDNGHFYSALDLAPISEPGRFIFVVDTSESLEDKVPAIRDAVMALVNRLSNRDRFSLVSFDDQPRVLILDTSDRARLKEQLNGLLPLYRLRRSSLTSVEAALVRALELARNSKEQNQVIFLFSDGLSSKFVKEAVALPQLLQQSRVIVHGIHFGGALSPQATRDGYQRMQEWAELSGGRTLASDRAGSIGDMMKQLQTLVLQRYRLRYAPDPSNYQPGPHRVKISNKKHPDYFFSFVPYYFAGTCRVADEKACQILGSEKMAGGQLFPRPGRRVAPVLDPIWEEFDFSNPGKEVTRLFAKVGPHGIYNFYPEPVISGEVSQVSMLHVIQSRGIPNLSFRPAHTDYTRGFCVLAQDDSLPVQTPALQWQRPYLNGEPFEVKLSGLEDYSGTLEGVSLKSRFISMRLIPTSENHATNGNLVVNCHLPLEFELFKGTSDSQRWKRPSDDPVAKTGFTWASTSRILADLFEFEVEHFQ